MDRRSPECTRFVRSVTLAALSLVVIASVTRNYSLVRLAAGVIALYGAGELAAAAGALAKLIWAAPGAVLVAANLTVPVHQRWAPPLVVIVILAGSVLCVDYERRNDGRGTTAALVLLTIGGFYACVPETGHIGALAVGAGAWLLSEFLTGERVGPGVMLAAVGVMMWAVVYGGTYRDSALVGGFASLGLLLVEPVARRLPGPPRGLVAERLGRALAMILLQGSYALLVSRTAGLAPSLARALLLAGPCVLALVLVSRFVLGPIAPDSLASTATANSTWMSRRARQPGGR